MTDPSNPVPVFGRRLPSDKKLYVELPPDKEAKLPLVRFSDGRYGFDPRVVIGEDNRVQVKNTSAWPWCVHGHLIIVFPGRESKTGL